MPRSSWPRSATTSRDRESHETERPRSVREEGPGGSAELCPRPSGGDRAAAGSGGDAGGGKREPGGQGSGDAAGLQGERGAAGFGGIPGSGDEPSARAGDLGSGRERAIPEGAGAASGPAGRDSRGDPSLLVALRGDRASELEPG